MHTSRDPAIVQSDTQSNDSNDDSADDRGKDSTDSEHETTGEQRTSFPSVTHSLSISMETAHLVLDSSDGDDQPTATDDHTSHASTDAADLPHGEQGSASVPSAGDMNDTVQSFDLDPSIGTDQVAYDDDFDGDDDEDMGGDDDDDDAI